MPVLKQKMTSLIRTFLLMAALGTLGSTVAQAACVLHIAAPAKNEFTICDDIKNFDDFQNFVTPLYRDRGYETVPLDHPWIDGHLSIPIGDLAVLPALNFFRDGHTYYTREVVSYSDIYRANSRAEELLWRSPLDVTERTIHRSYREYKCKNSLEKLIALTPRCGELY